MLLTFTGIQRKKSLTRRMLAHNYFSQFPDRSGLKYLKLSCKNAIPKVKLIKSEKQTFHRLQSAFSGQFELVVPNGLSPLPNISITKPVFRICGITTTIANRNQNKKFRTTKCPTVFLEPQFASGVSHPGTMPGSGSQR